MPNVIGPPDGVYVGGSIDPVLNFKLGQPCLPEAGAGSSMSISEESGLTRWAWTLVTSCLDDSMCSKQAFFTPSSEATVGQGAVAYMDSSCTGIQFVRGFNLKIPSRWQQLPDLG